MLKEIKILILILLLIGIISYTFNISDASSYKNNRSNSDLIKTSLPKEATNIEILDEEAGWFYFELNNKKYLGKLNILNIHAVKYGIITFSEK